MKTAKSIEIARRATQHWSGAVAVSTLAEAEAFAQARFSDIHYAVGLAPNKLVTAMAVAARGVNLSVSLDSIEAARALGAVDRDCPDSLSFFIEIDVDGGRGGVPFDDAARIRAVFEALGPAKHRLKGLMAHAGGSYGCATTEDRARVARQEMDRIVNAAIALEGPLSVLSVGSTPTALTDVIHNDVSEIRAGAYMFMDRTMAGLGVCEPSDIALSVLTSVIGVREQSNEILIDAGWMALSADRGVGLDGSLGSVCDTSLTPIPEARLHTLNQEHGVIRFSAKDGAVRGAFTVGDLLRILPNHACATAAQHQAYVVVDAGGAPSAHWPRIQGW